MSDIKVSVVGAGHIAGAHLAAWRRARGCRVVGVFDVAGEAAERRRREFGLAAAFDDLAAAIAAADVVDVCTPPETHVDIVERAAAAGRHLLVEKPIVIRLAEWERLLPLLERGPGRLAVVHNLKFSAAMRRARRWLVGGRIGRLLRFEHHFLTDPAADRMLAQPHWSHALPGGRWFETLPHALYLIHALAGPLAVEHVTALAGVHPPLGAPADEVQVTLAGRDCLAALHYSANCPANRRTIALEGSAGRVDWDVLADVARLSRRRDTRWRRALGPGLAGAAGDLAAAVPERAGYLGDRLRGRSPHARLIAEFAAHLRGEAPSPTPLAEVDYVVRAGEAIGRAIDLALEETRAAR